LRKKDDKKIEAIKKTVIKLIRDYGFHGISMAKIAKEAGVSPATIYIYYENKSIMIHEIYHELRMERHNSIHKNITSEMNAKEALKTIFRSYYDYITIFKLSLFV
jgi:AcrR family transcriptional regulator